MQIDLLLPSISRVQGKNILKKPDLAGLESLCTFQHLCTVLR
jgi:hypothetical protein